MLSACKMLVMLYFYITKNCNMIKDIQDKLLIFNGRIPFYLKNKFIVMSLMFLVWMTFFDRNGFVTHFKLYMTERNMRLDKEQYIEDIKSLKEAQSDLEQNIERFAREKYFLQKPNEEVFIITKE